MTQNPEEIVVDFNFKEIKVETLCFLEWKNPIVLQVFLERGWPTLALDAYRLAWRGENSSHFSVLAFTKFPII